jgi:hypothetical protein
MRKIYVLIIVIFMGVGIAGCVGTVPIKKIRFVKSISEEKALAAIKDKPWFHVRKRFTYLMAWNCIPVGKITAESGDIKNYQGRDVYVMKLVTESNKFLSRIYRVEDTYTSYIDIETMTSRRYEADRKEGNYRKHVIVEYDFEKMEAVYTNLTDGTVKRCPISENVQDPLSAICYFMTLPITLGEEVNMTVNLNEKNYQLFGKVEAVNVVKLPRLGSHPAFKLRPYAKLKGKHLRRGSGWMYFSADENRYPLYGVVLIPFGRVTATLRTIEDI